MPRRLSAISGPDISARPTANAFGPSTTTSSPTRMSSSASTTPGASTLPGIVNASDDIRVGDEVVVEGPKAFAVGRAEMSGPAMAESTRGVAVAVRHVEET